MKNCTRANKQDGFLEIGAGLLILALFGGTAAVIAPDGTNKVYAQQEALEPALDARNQKD